MFSGADLENLVNEAALIAAMRGLDSVTMPCFEEARDKVRFGKERKSRQMDEEERRMTAWHEAGHTILMQVVPHVTPLHKVTIIPRGRSLGSTMQLPEKDEYSLKRKRILGEMVVALGGRAAEELFLDDITSGAAMDLQQMTRYARAMVCEWGMCPDIGLPYLGNDDKEYFFSHRPYSEEMARRIDDEVKKLTDEAYEEAKRLLVDYKEDMEILVEALLEFEALSREEVELIRKEKSLDPLRDRRKSAREKEDTISLEKAVKAALYK